MSAVSFGLRCVSSGGRLWACAFGPTHSDVASTLIRTARLARRLFASLGMGGVLGVGQGMATIARAVLYASYALVTAWRAPRSRSASAARALSSDARAATTPASRTPWSRMGNDRLTEN